MNESASMIDFEQLINGFITEIGPAWLASHASSPSRPEPTLASWIRMTKNTPSEDRPKNQVSLQLARLARDIAILRCAEVAGAEERIKQITDENEDKFYSTVQELNTASTYIRLDQTVYFIAEANKRTSDLMINENIEVECKYKARETDIDRKRYELYGLLNRRTQRALEQTGSASAVQIELSFRDEPTRVDIDEIEVLVREAVRPSGPFAFARTHGNFSYTVRAEHSERGPGVQLFLPQNLMNEYDFLSTEGRIVAGDRGNRMENVSQLAIKCDVLQDRVKSLSKSLKSASGQFSHRGPAIIQIDVTSSIKELIAGRLPRSGEVVSSFLRNNRSVSAVVFEHDHFHREQDQLILSRTLEIIPNEGARNPLPASLLDRLSN